MKPSASYNPPIFAATCRTVREPSEKELTILGAYHSLPRTRQPIQRFQRRDTAGQSSLSNAGVKGPLSKRGLYSSLSLRSMVRSAEVS